MLLRNVTSAFTAYKNVYIESSKNWKPIEILIVYPSPAISK